jgi:hypothetical protein
VDHPQRSGSTQFSWENVHDIFENFKFLDPQVDRSPAGLDAWINPEATTVGYEVSFTRHFYNPKPLRSLAEIAADIRAIEAEAEGLLDGLLVGAGCAVPYARQHSPWRRQGSIRNAAFNMEACGVHAQA